MNKINSDNSEDPSKQIDIDAVNKNWFYRGFSCGIWTDAPGQKWENFVHETDELVMVLEGQVEFEFNDEVMQPSIGEELLIPANTIHSVRNTGITTSRWLYGYKQAIL